MSAASNHHSQRARIAECLQDHLGNHSQREIGRELGVAGTTVAARGSDLHAWPAAELLTLALRDEALASSIVAYLRGDTKRATGEAIALHGDLLTVLADCAVLDQAVIPQVDRSTPAGRKLIRGAMTRLRDHMDRVDADLTAADQVTA